MRRTCRLWRESIADKLPEELTSITLLPGMYVSGGHVLRAIYAGNWPDTYVAVADDAVKRLYDIRWDIWKVHRDIDVYMLEDLPKTQEYIDMFGGLFSLNHRGVPINYGRCDYLYNKCSIDFYPPYSCRLSHLESKIPIRQVLLRFDIPICAFAFDGKKLMFPESPHADVFAGSCETWIPCKDSNPERLEKYRSRGFIINETLPPK